MADFNPSDHTVDEVKAHLDKNPDDFQRVVSAEKADKNRNGITGLSAPGGRSATGGADVDTSVPEASLKTQEERDELKRQARLANTADVQGVQAEAAKGGT